MLAKSPRARHASQEEPRGFTRCLPGAPRVSGEGVARAHRVLPGAPRVPSGGRRAGSPGIPGSATRPFRGDSCGLTGCVRERRVSWQESGELHGELLSESPRASPNAPRALLPRRPEQPLGRAPSAQRAQGIRTSGLWSCSRSCLGRSWAAGPCGPAPLPSRVDGLGSHANPERGDMGDPVSHITDSADAYEICIFYIMISI